MQAAHWLADFIVLVLVNSFYGREGLGLTYRLLTELPGILNLSIAKWSGAPGTPALLSGATSLKPERKPQKPAPVAPAENSDEAADLSDDFLIALLELPGDTLPDLVAALPSELYDRIDRYLEVRLT